MIKLGENSSFELDELDLITGERDRVDKFQEIQLSFYSCFVCFLILISNFVIFFYFQVRKSSIFYVFMDSK